MTTTGSENKPSVQEHEDGGIELHSRQANERIRQLRIRARQGGWGMLVFVLISTIAIPNFRFFPVMPEKIRDFLGEAPPTNWIGIALMIYAFSALVLTLTRVVHGTGKYYGWSHLFYITSFYIFYGFSDGLEDNYWAVFTAGLTIMGLENYQIRSYCSNAISSEIQLLERLAKRRAKNE